MSANMCPSGISNVTSMIDEAIDIALIEVLGTDEGKRKNLYNRLSNAINERVQLAYENAIEAIENRMEEIKIESYDEGLEEGQEDPSSYDNGFEDGKREIMPETPKCPICPTCQSELENNNGEIICTKCRREFTLTECFVANVPTGKVN